MDTNLLQQLEAFLYNGEFAAWLNEQEMPCAAAKELEEFEAMVDSVRDNELRVD
jgi:hypothetical protein